MTELLPVDQAEALTMNLLEFLGTTFSLDTQTRDALDRFLTDERTGMFRGPFVRLRLPFAPARSGWEETLPNRRKDFVPYGHQAAAFARLSSANGHQPLPTVVTTGTGSGKTESFLYPILDHIVRANQAGKKGTKALILYPMNALANDQAQRLTELLTTVPAYKGITAALYTGEATTTGRTKVTSQGLITNRDVIRSKAPDVLLTNYKMLDQLLLRHADAGIWSQSAESLAYLVIDEFHSYDGAQGTDVAMLLRRLGMALNTSGGEESHGALGKVVPVATSATLGDDGDPSSMLSFFRTVTGAAVDIDAVVTETRLSYDEWSGTARRRVNALGLAPRPLDKVLASAIIEELERGSLTAQASSRPGLASDPDKAVRVVLSHLYSEQKDDGFSADPIDLSAWNDEGLLDLLAAHPLTKLAVEGAERAVPLPELARSLFEAQYFDARSAGVADLFTSVFLSTISHVKAVCKPSGITVDVHVWIRELTRVDRTLDLVEPAFRWADDGVTEDDGVGALPAVYCRACGRSGWGALLEPTGNSLTKATDKIRGRHAGGDERFRALIFASGEAENLERAETSDVSSAEAEVASGDSVMWLNVRERALTAQKDPHADEGEFIPVLTQTGPDAGKKSKQDVCPSCGTKDSIRFLGSAIATQLSVTLSGLLATRDMDNKERRALVFTDSVQDAAHRAGFVQARSFALTLRSLMRECLEEGPLALADLPAAMMEKAGRDPIRRYALLPPELADRERFENYWRHPNRRRLAKEERLVTTRLGFDVQLEFGLRSSVGRTLEVTGTATTEFTVDDRVLLSAAQGALEELGIRSLPGFETTEQKQLRWVIGVLQHMRARGAIEHDWWNAYRTENGSRWKITGGRKKADGMPAFRPGVSAPSFPVTGPKSRLGEDLEPVASTQGWYAIWTSKALSLPRAQSASLVGVLLEQLVKREIVGSLPSTTGHLTYALQPDRILARAVNSDEIGTALFSVQCDVCDAMTTAAPHLISHLADGPCLSARCNGTLYPRMIGENYYRNMYSARGTRRIVAREHTSLLPTATRMEYENKFKETAPEPDAPNVLVATPTLEMGIDIGDLSSVLLSALPRSVASYLQRVGRAGRMTGNALTVAFVTARGDQLPRFFHPDETINGAVRPPATYLNALEILKRQYLASVGDRLARAAGAPHPVSTVDALKSLAPGGYLATLIEEGQRASSVEDFLQSFVIGADSSDLTARTAADLRAWAVDSVTSPVDDLEATALATRCQRASASWNARIEELSHQLDTINKALPDIQERASAPAADEESKVAFRTALAAQRLTKRQVAELKNEYWISSMESFGLFPNYTLIDDSVSLEVGLSWLDSETQEYRSDDLSVERASARALREFAPGSTFYTQGYAIEIDAVDLGSQGERIHTWACCPACGHVQDLGPGETDQRPNSTCPRCGNAGIGDLSQRLRVVELKSVSAVMRRDEAVIDDRQDDRRTVSYNIMTLADLDAENADSWFVPERDFGVRHSREIGMRWINLGMAHSRGVDIELGGTVVTAPLFRVCEYCGKLDTESGMNTAREHRPWCPVRNDSKEHVVPIALARHLTTEGLFIRVPQAEALGEASSLPSLAAAFMLALGKHLGGSPDHLQIAEVADPSGEGESNPAALLIYDTVPGGTGYLTELAAPERLFGILATAYTDLENCPCGETDLLACEKCLLPFAPAGQVQTVSRVAAIRGLAKILGAQEDGTMPAESWPAVTREEPTPASSESYIEQYFRQALRKRVIEDGGGISEKQGIRGSVWRVAAPSGAGWRMEPQVDLFGSRPDFVLTSANPNNPPTAVFMDGRSYHFSQAHNRVADDAVKRQTLRDAGYRVLGLTLFDLEQGDSKESEPEWYNEQVTNVLMVQGQTGLSRSEFDFISASPVELILRMMNATEGFRSLDALAQWIPFYFFSAGEQTSLRNDETLVDATFSYLTRGKLPSDDSAAGLRMASIWKAGALAVGAAQLLGREDQLEMVVILDDSLDAVSGENTRSWQGWLHLANLVGGRLDPTVITTVSCVEGSQRSALGPGAGALHADTAGAPADAYGISAKEKDTPEVPNSWKRAFDEATDDEREVLTALLRGIDAEIPAPEIGMETPDGIPLGIAWPKWKVTISWDGIDDADLAALGDTGWAVLEQDPDHLPEELAIRLGVN